MNSQAGSGYLEGPSSASSEAARRHDTTRRLRSYRRRSRSLSRRGRSAVPRVTVERNRVVREVMAATAQTLGYVAVTGLAIWLAFTYVP